MRHRVSSHFNWTLLSLMHTPRLPVVDWTDAPADLSKLVRFAERRNLVSARVPSHFKRSLPPWLISNLMHKILIYLHTIHLLKPSTCFEHYPAHLQEVYVVTVYSVSQEEGTKLREGVPYVKVYRYNPKHLCPKLNGYGDNGQRSLKLWQLLHICWLPNTY